MITIKVNDQSTLLNATLQDVKIITGGYLTPEKTFICKALEKIGTSRAGECIDFYVTEDNKLFSFHYGQSLGVGKIIIAIDYFPKLQINAINKAYDLVMSGIRKHRIRS